MATPENGKITQFELGIVERVAAGIRYMVTGNAPAWFGPNAPMLPQAPDDVKGRPFDFPVGVNLQYQPRREASESGITFDVLRRVSDPALGGLDLVRLAIETRKDQMEAQKWIIRGKDGKDGGQRAKDMTVALRRPDLVHTYRQWARMLWEDLLVCDAPSIYLRPMPGGFKIPEVVDGGTIKILADPNGRRPLPPDPAFQQIIKGLPAVDYRVDELIYAPRNMRPNKFYGMSPVEQTLNIVNLGLKRQLHLISFYTAGNVPEQLIAAPPQWNPDQVRKGQEWLDTMLEGNLEARRKMIMVPGGMEPKPLKDTHLFDPLDEWIARVVCWSFSLSPQALVKEVNRATAQTSAQQSRMEGLNPLKEWWTDVMNDVLAQCWGADDLEFAFVDEDIVDPKLKSEVIKTYVESRVITKDEARDQLGMKPMTPDQKDELAPAPPPMAAGLGNGGPTPPQGVVPADSASQGPLPSAAKLVKKKSLVPLNPDRPRVKRVASIMRKATSTYLSAIRGEVVAALKSKKMAKSDFTPEEFRSLWGSMAEDERKEWLQRMEAAMASMATDGAEGALSQLLGVAISENEFGDLLAQANEDAVAWAAEHAAELVKDVDQVTMQGIQDLVTRAMEDGWSNDKLGDMIEESGGFAESRADMIARTETARADVQGSLAGYRRSGVVEARQWAVAQDEVCDDCVELDGKTAAIDADFPEGDPPLHPNCRCAILPVVTQPDTED